MNRRTFTRAAAAASLAGPMAASSTPAILELRVIKMRNGSDSQVKRTTDFLGKSLTPSLQRAGIGPVGCFTSVIAADSPFILMVISHPGLAGMEANYARQGADKEYLKERDAYYSEPGLPYMRMETSLLRAFPSMPAIEAPPKKEGGTRIFELRTYESNNLMTLARKIKMFGDSEIPIFRRTGLLPVFFGETIVGRNQPNLTYMLAFDDLAAREKNFRAFVSDPEWAKLSKQPGLTDPEIVSNISNSILRPLPFSQIR